jgi:hypothetical protein
VVTCRLGERGVDGMRSCPELREGIEALADLAHIGGALWRGYNPG